MRALCNKHSSVGCRSPNTSTLERATSLTAHRCFPSLAPTRCINYRCRLQALASPGDGLTSAPTSALLATPEALADSREPLSSTDYGFGFSAGGLLFPYFLGVALQLQALGVLRPETPVAGASAGSIIAVCTKSGLSEQQLMAALLDLAQDCRLGGTRARLKFVLRRVLEDCLPPDIHERCQGRAFLAVTRLWPEFRPQTVSSFRSRRDLIDTVLVSCHIPYWFDGSLFTLYREGIYFDGGITNFIPRTPTDVCHRVCCFPSQKLRAFPNIDLSPDTYEPWPFDMRTMLGWAFEPAPEDMLLSLVDKGKRDARAWAALHAAPAAAASAAVLGSAGPAGAGAGASAGAGAAGGGSSEGGGPPGKPLLLV